MTQPEQSPAAKERFDRAAAAMRENLKRRKQQQQARSAKAEPLLDPKEKE